MFAALLSKLFPPSLESLGHIDSMRGTMLFWRRTSRTNVYDHLKISFDGEQGSIGNVQFKPYRDAIDRITKTGRI